VAWWALKEEVSMEKFTEWVTSKFQHPLGLLFFLLGALLILLGVTTGLELPVLQQLAPDVNYRWVSLALGVIFLLLATLIYYRPPRATKGIEPVPDELTRSFTARRAGLTGSQTRILVFIEQEGFRQRFVSQDTIETKFDKYGKSEIFYRLEQLRFLGFLERQRVGRDESGYDRFTYRLSAGYQKELGDVELCL
jgi:hypothetical protein